MWQLATRLFSLVALVDATGDVLRKKSLRMAGAAKQPMTIGQVIQNGEIVNGVPYYDNERQILAIQPQAVSKATEASNWRDFDENRDGYISLKEIKDYLYELRNNHVANDADAKVIFDKLDLDGNGSIDPQEFETPLDTELFDFLDREHNQVGVKEIEFVEDLYTKEYGNPMASMRNEPPAQYNIRGEEISAPEADEKYLPGYGWFKGESPVIDEMYKGEIMDSPTKEAEEINPGAQYKYSYGL
jgi:hypothetical protein